MYEFRPIHFIPLVGYLPFRLDFGFNRRTFESKQMREIDPNYLRGVHLDNRESIYLIYQLTIIGGLANFLS